MAERIVVVGAPSSAGAYAPGQEPTPQALRAAGLLDKLRARGIAVEDVDDTDLVRWRADQISGDDRFHPAGAPAKAQDFVEDPFNSPRALSDVVSARTRSRRSTKPTLGAEHFGHPSEQELTTSHQPGSARPPPMTGTCGRIPPSRSR